MSKRWRAWAGLVCGSACLSLGCGGGTSPGSDGGASDSGSGADAGVDSGCISVPSNLPSSLAAPASVQPVLELHAKGQQLYVCKAIDAGTYGWSFVAPQASLYPACDPTGMSVGQHFAGPTWQWDADGSEFVGNGARAVKAPSPDDPVNDIPWLLLPRKSASDAGYFSTFQYAQRVNTVGGVAPSSGCDQSSVGADAGVDYQANYLYYQ